MAKVTLLEAPADMNLKVVYVQAGRDIRQHLGVMGIHINDILVKQNWAKWGPILVLNKSNSNAKVAIGRGLAEKIFVEF